MKKIIGMMIVIIIMVSIAALPAYSQETQTFTIGFYGDSNSGAALGVGTAILEIQEFGAITGGDGVTYNIGAIASDDIADLNGVDAIITVPDAEPINLETPLDIPVIVIDSSADLAETAPYANIVFRGMTDQATLYTAFADFSIQQNNAQRFALIGDDEFYSEEFIQLATALGDVGGQVDIAIVDAETPSEEQLRETVTANPQVIFYLGMPENASSTLAGLESTGWGGVFVYPNAYEAAQSGELTVPQNIQVVGFNAWSNSTTDGLGRAFRISYIEKTGKLPTAQSVSAYDVTWALRLMIQRVGGDGATIAAALPIAEAINTTQGLIDLPAYGGETFFSAASIYTLQPLGGMEQLARYDNGELLTDTDVAQGDEPESLPTNDAPSPTPNQPSPTPSQPTATVNVDALRVRTGPGFDYNIIGRLNEGDQVGVVGTIPDFSWFYVQGSNGLGWIKAEFVTLFNPAGGVQGIPTVPIPPTPTPAPTVTPSGPADITITNVALSVPRIIKGQQFTATVTVQNVGVNPINEAFAIAASWFPDEAYTSAFITPPLNPGQSQDVILSVTLNTTGPATTVVIGDLNNDIQEGNEDNNNFEVSYVVDAQPTAIQTITLTNPLPQTLDLGGAAPGDDLEWTGTAINALNTAKVNTLAQTFDSAYVSLIGVGNINQTTVNPLANGTIFGFRSGDLGDDVCGVFQIVNVAAPTLQLQYRIYSAADCPF